MDGSWVGAKGQAVNIAREGSRRSQERLVGGEKEKVTMTGGRAMPSVVVRVRVQGRWVQSQV
jgi:hypothetical protein